MIENEGKSLNENIQYFTLYKYKVNSNKGGDDYHNDCLYYACTGRGVIKTIPRRG